MEIRKAKKTEIDGVKVRKTRGAYKDVCEALTANPDGITLTPESTEEARGVKFALRNWAKSRGSRCSIITNDEGLLIVRLLPPKE